MTPEAGELARALVAAPWWEWRPRMRCIDEDGHPWTRLPGGSWQGDLGGYCGGDLAWAHWPDLDDPATVGVLLAMIDESHEVARINNVRRYRREVGIVLQSGVYTGPTLGVAVARALLAVRGAA